MIAFAGAFLAYAGISGGSASAATPVVGAGLGAAMRIENSPYRRGGTPNDFVPSTFMKGNYLDLSADVSIGDLIRIKSMRETYMGMGVSHRSGIFGTSRLLGNVNGGSNYISSHLEWRM
jgi:outer membrane protein